MKIIPLKKLGSKENPFDYREMIKVIARLPSPEKGGIDFLEIKQALRITKALDKLSLSKKKLKLEDADHSYLVKKAEKHKWGVASEEIEEFVEDIINAVDLEEKKDEK